MDKGSRIGWGIVAAVVVAAGLFPCCLFIISQTQLVAWWVDVATPRHDFPDMPPPPAVFEAAIELKLDRIEGRTIHMTATAPAFGDGAHFTATAYREFKHADEPYRPMKRLGRRWEPGYIEEYRRTLAKYEAGEVCTSVRMETVGGALRWSCEVDDARWLTGQKIRPPLISDDVVVELVWKSQTYQPDALRKLTGPRGEYMRGLCVMPGAYGRACAERLRVNLPLTAQDMPTSGTE